MSDANATSATGGIGFFGLLTIVLVILKATGYIDWSWWLVFSPIIVGFAIGAVILLFILAVWLLAIVAIGLK